MGQGERRVSSPLSPSAREALADLLLHLREARRIVGRALPLVGDLPESIAREVLTDLEITIGALDYAPEDILEIVARGGGHVSFLPELPRSWGDQLTH